MRFFTGSLAGAGPVSGRSVRGLPRLHGRLLGRLDGRLDWRLRLPLRLASTKGKLVELPLVLRARVLPSRPSRRSPCGHVADEIAAPSAELARVETLLFLCAEGGDSISCFSTLGLHSSFFGDTITFDQTWFKMRSDSFRSLLSSGFFRSFQGSRRSTSERQRFAKADLKDRHNESCCDASSLSRDKFRAWHSRSNLRLPPHRRRSFSVTVICSRGRGGMPDGFGIPGSIRTVRMRCGWCARSPQTAGVLTWQSDWPSMLTCLCGVMVQSSRGSELLPTGSRALPGWLRLVTGVQCPLAWRDTPGDARSTLGGLRPLLVARCCSTGSTMLSR
mmetsp:Transcript_17410/g.55101  ORF Transcript_17410/g.55101 Transcript_17410/m.55101 type:complete len:332 (-) Transcript_17410:154-1149(-)